MTSRSHIVQYTGAQVPISGARAPIFWTPRWVHRDPAHDPWRPPCNASMCWLLAHAAHFPWPTERRCPVCYSLSIHVEHIKSGRVWASNCLGLHPCWPLCPLPTCAFGAGTLTGCLDSPCQFVASVSEHGGSPALLCVFRTYFCWAFPVYNARVCVWSLRPSSKMG